MTEHPDIATFELFTMGALENDEAFVGHVAGCDACSATLAREARLELLLKDVPAHPRKLRTIVRLSLPFAAIAVAAAAILVAHGTTPSDRTVSTASSSAASASASADDADDDTPEARIVDAALGTKADACLKAGAAKDPTMAGRVDIEATIAPDGQVTRSNVTKNDGLPDEVAQCIATVYRNASFPPRGRTHKHTATFVYIKRTPKP